MDYVYGAIAGVVFMYIAFAVWDSIGTARMKRKNEEREEFKRLAYEQAKLAIRSHEIDTQPVRREEYRASNRAIDNRIGALERLL